ncbi:MAG: DUF222 domain-containing protein [Actinomycetales bacterium]
MGGLTAGHVREALVTLDRQARRIESIRLAFVRASLDHEPDGQAHGRATRAVLADRCSRDRGAARADVRAAELIHPEHGILRGFGAALAAGEVSAAHLDVARKVVAKLPAAILDAHREQIDAVLTEHARRWSPRLCAGLAEHLLEVVDPDRADRRYRDACARRGLSVATDAFGMTVLRGQLDPDAGLEFTAVLDHLLALDRARPDLVTTDTATPDTVTPDTSVTDTGTAQAPGGVTSPPTPGHDAADPGAPDHTAPDAGSTDDDAVAASLLDTRTPAQRRADALVRMAQLAAEQLALVFDEKGLPRTDGPGGAINQRPARSVPHVSITLTQGHVDATSKQPMGRHDVDSRPSNTQGASVFATPGETDNTGQPTPRFADARCDCAHQSPGDVEPIDLDPIDLDSTSPDMLNGHTIDRHTIDGHTTDRHATDGHATDRDPVGRHAINRHATDEGASPEPAISGRQLDQHTFDKQATTEVRRRTHSPDCSARRAGGPVAWAVLRPESQPWAVLGPESQPLPAALLGRALCDAVLDYVTRSGTGRVLSMHTTGRLATPAQATAVAARDGGCVFPGCAAPPSMCQVHHVRFWSDGGPTHIDNLALLCWRHHQVIHHAQGDSRRDGWRLIMRDGLAYAIPPAHIDPDQRPIRNTLRQAIDETRAMAIQLTMDVAQREHPPP